MLPHRWLRAFACVHGFGTVTSYQFTPTAHRFPAHGGIPPFSITLGNDTGFACNSSTPGTSGFIHTNGGGDGSMFFWLFESKNDPRTDPLILWMSGGPGASSTGYGNLMELGPCRIASEGGSTVENPFGWNTNASVIFVDQPTSVGFSHGKSIPNGLQEASELMHTFLRQFLVAFPTLADVDFYIAGESYGGSWVPALADTILKRQTPQDRLMPQILEQFGSNQAVWHDSPTSPHVNLKGAMIGNGLIRRSVQNPGSFEAACAGPDSLLTTHECEHWAPRAMWCERNLDICETAGWTSTVCKDAEQKCSEMSEYVIGTLGRNPYDWRRSCGDDDLCYPEMTHIDEFMNRSDVKAALGVDVAQSFQGISYDVFRQWEEVGDLWKSSDHYVNDLLDMNIRVLIYVGDKDWHCNAAGMRRLVNEGLTWNGHPFFRFRELIPWYSAAKVAGRGKSYGPLTYAEIADAGHLAPFDKAEATLVLINSWIRGGLPAQ